MRTAPPRLAWRLQLLVLFSAVGLFFLLRSFYAFTLPDLACEDGSEMFAYYTNHPTPGYILRSYSGYISLLPNLVGYLAARLPPPLVPYALAYYALLVKTTAFTLFAGRRFRFTVANDHWRLLIVVAAALMPLGDRLLSDNATYSIWNLLLILCLLVVAPLPRRRRALFVQFGLLVLCAWSTPVAVVVAPLCLYNFLTRRRAADRWVNGGLMLAIGLYVWLAVHPAVHPADGVVRSLWQSIALTPLYLLNRVVAETLLGYHLRMAMQNQGLTWLIYLVATIFVTGLAGLYVVNRRALTRREHSYLVMTLFLITAITWFSIYARGMDSNSHMGPWNGRYFYVQQYLFVLLLAVGMARNWRRLPRRWLRPVLAGGLVVYLVAMVSFNLPYFRAYPELGRTLATFLQTVDAYQRTSGPVAPREFVLPRPCFDIRVRVPAPAANKE